LDQAFGGGNIHECTDRVQSTFASGLSLPAGLAFNSAGICLWRVMHVGCRRIKYLCRAPGPKESRGGSRSGDEINPGLFVYMLVIRENVLVSRFMNILIEEAETLQYLAPNNQWTRNVSEGRTFGATRTAFEVAKHEPIGKFNIVYYIAQTGQFINLDHGRGKGLANVSA
jgi:hypothetical protein